MSGEIFVHGFFGFADVYGQDQQPFVSGVFVELVDIAGFFGAILAPGGPEIEKHDFAFDAVVGEVLAGDGFGVKVGCWLAGLWCGEDGNGGEQQREGENAAQGVWAKHNARQGNTIGLQRGK